MMEFVSIKSIWKLQVQVAMSINKREISEKNPMAFCYCPGEFKNYY
jgi:hypothetical protein